MSEGVGGQADPLGCKTPTSFYQLNEREPLKRFIAVAASIAVLAIAVAACAPPKTPVSAPPKFKLAAGIWHTLGTAPGATECHFVRIDGEGHAIPGSDVHSKTGARYVQTGANDSEFQTSGCQPFVLSRSPGDTPHFGVQGIPFDPRSTGFHLASGDGDYLIGNHDFWTLATWTGDIPDGTYQLQNGTSCQWTMLRDFKGEANSAWASGNAAMPAGQFPPSGFLAGSIHVPAPSHQPDGTLVYDIAGIRLFNCGPTIYFYG